VDTDLEKEKEAKSAKETALAGPKTITIEASSPRGPFARDGAEITVPLTRVVILNRTSAPITMTRFALDRLRRSQTGEALDSVLFVNVTPQLLSPGESATLTIAGRAPERPGVYASTLRVSSAEGEQFAAPVEIRVAARPVWGILCLAFGLLFAGSLNLLDSESGVKGELSRALRARDAAHQLLPSPAPPSLSALAENVNHDFDAAIDTLQKPREPSFVDHRSKDSEEPLKAAQEMTASLRKILTEKPRSAIELSDLQNQWRDLKDVFDALAKLYLVSAPAGSSLQERLGAFDAWAADRLLRTPIDYYARDFPAQIVKVRLLYAGGRDADAALEAGAVRRQMRRAGDSVSKLARRLTFFIQNSANNITSVTRIREQVETPGFPPDRRAAILKSVDSAASLLSGPFNWSMRRDVDRLIEDSATETLRSAKDAVIAGVEAAGAQEAREDSLETVQAVIDEGAKLKRGPDGKTDIKEKIALQRRIVDAWRNRLATLPGPNPPTLVAEIEAMEKALDANDLETFRTGMLRLRDQWSAYRSSRAETLNAKAAAPFCLRVRGDLVIGLEAARQSSRLLEGDPDIMRWEGELDRLRIATDATPDVAEKMGPDCIKSLVGLSRDLGRLRNEIWSAMWNAATLPDATRKELAGQLGAMLTPQALANLTTATRQLSIEVETPKEERYAERPIEFKIGNLGPNWGPGVLLGIDFGDAQRAFASAEELRQKLLTHAYASPKTVKLISVVAADSFKPGTLEPARKLFGEGRLESLVINPSPISLARQLSDQLFNARFAVALLLASLLYFWRFHVQKSVFGARVFDYAEAFALGFVVSLAVNELPQRLAEFAPFKP
jgi:hypothetical protein